jgi:hypothetical protein
LIPNLMPKCECLSIHSSLPSVRATSPRDPANPAQTVLLLNENTLPTAGISAESSEEISPCRSEFVTKFGPQISLRLVPIFGVNNLNVVAPCTRDIHTFFTQRGKVEHDSPIMVAIQPRTSWWPKKNSQTNSRRYLCNSVICTISSCWMLWIGHISAASSCKLLENLVCFSLIILH